MGNPSFQPRQAKQMPPLLMISLLSDELPVHERQFCSQLATHVGERLALPHVLITSLSSQGWAQQIQNATKQWAASSYHVLLVPWNCGPHAMNDSVLRELSHLIPQMEDGEIKNYEWIPPSGILLDGAAQKNGFGEIHNAFGEMLPYIAWCPGWSQYSLKTSSFTMICASDSSSPTPPNAEIHVQALQAAISPSLSPIQRPGPQYYHDAQLFIHSLISLLTHISH